LSHFGYLDANTTEHVRHVSDSGSRSSRDCS
jgi:hypothetical protein